MISYETYKALHIFFIICFFSSIGMVFTDRNIIGSLKGKILIGVMSFLILVAGMGLIARLGYKHDQAFPFWIKLKIINWSFINILFVVLIKNKNIQIKIILGIGLLMLAWCGIWLAINKPL